MARPIAVSPAATHQPGRLDEAVAGVPFVEPLGHAVVELERFDRASPRSSRSHPADDARQFLRGAGG